MKEPRVLLGPSYLTSREMRKVVMHIAVPVSTREATEILVQILNIIYAKADLKQVSNNATQINAEEWTQLLILVENSEDLFGGTPGDWYTDPFDQKLNPDFKPFNCKYYPVPIINKETFHE